MRDKIKLVICAGGTGGHIYPGIAVADKLKKTNPASEIIFFSSGKNIEKEIFDFNKISTVKIKSMGFIKGKGAFNLFGSLLLSFSAFFASLYNLSKIRPDAVFCTGGYLTLPVVLSSRVLRIPVILHEQNALPGRANQISKYFAEKVAVTFEESVKYFGRMGVICGNPVREKILNSDKTKSRKDLGIPEDKKVILITGGSQGAASLNNAAVDLPALLDDPNIYIIHICGRSDQLRMEEKTRGFKNYKLLPYVDDISSVLASSDLAVSRAGATMLSEISALGIPSVLIPYPHSANRHQNINAAIFGQKGAAKIIGDASLSGASLSDIIKELIYNREKLKEMSAAARSFFKKDTAEKIEDLIYEAI